MKLKQFYPKWPTVLKSLYILRQEINADSIIPNMCCNSSPAQLFSIQMHV